MAKLTPEEIANGLGVAPPPKAEPAGRVGAAYDRIGDLDAKLDKMALADRQPGESEAAAHARFHRENPTVYPTWKREKARILASHGLGFDAARGGL
jgi:hypothetical protein